MPLLAEIENRAALLAWANVGGEHASTVAIGTKVRKPSLGKKSPRSLSKQDNDTRKIGK